MRRFLAAALLAASGPVCAAVLQVDANGELTGAENVIVAGAAYDVSFVDDTCIALFDGCDTVSDFAFQSQDAAQAASRALLEQVFLDGASGAFDSDPALTAGCEAEINCIAFTPFFVAAGNPNVVFMIARNFNPALPDNVGDQAFFLARDAVPAANFVYAVWRQVPEPSSLALFAAGLALYGATRRTKG